jgi:tetratricopeptide (TPR) repeat protein
MRKFIFTAILLLAAAAGTNVPAQQRAGFDLSNYGVRIEPDKRVMIVLAALDTARTEDADGNTVRSLNTPLSAEGTEFRDLLSSDLLKMPNDLRTKISVFVNRYKSHNPKLKDSEIVAPFVSMAYSLTPAPELNDPIVTSSLPGDVLNVLDFAPLVREFNRRTTISQNIDDYIKKYNAAADGQLRDTAKEMVGDLLQYMHTRPEIYFEEAVKVESKRAGKSTVKAVEKRSRERRFFIVPEMLAPKDTVIFLNIRDDYYVVIPPDTDLSFSDVRRAFLQFVLDPLILKSSKDIDVIREPVSKFLNERRAVNPEQSPDVFLVLSRSLAAAIDIQQREVERIAVTTAQARQRIENEKSPDEKRKISAELERLKREFADESVFEMSKEYERGNVFVFYFGDKLDGVEDSGFNISSSLRNMILSIDPTKEANRLAENAEARNRAIAARESGRTTVETTFTQNPVTEGLLAIQEKIDAKNYTAAETDLKKLLEKYPDDARIYYSLGRVASFEAETLNEPEAQQRKLIESKVAYENVIRISQKQTVDPALLSLTYTALGRIYEFFDNTATALALYEKAIAIGPVARGAYDESLSAKARLIKEQQ